MHVHARCDNYHLRDHWGRVAKRETAGRGQLVWQSSSWSEWILLTGTDRKSSLIFTTTLFTSHSSFILFSKNFYVCFILCLYFMFCLNVHAVPSEARRGWQISWTKRQWCVLACRCSDLHLGPVEKQPGLSTASSSQSSPFCYRNRVSLYRLG